MQSLVNKSRPMVRENVQHLVRSMAARRASRRCLNLLYLALPEREKVRLHGLCHALFADGQPLIDDGRWIVRFAGKRIVLPLTATKAWQEWDAAVAILGHDLEVKITYASLLRSPRRPKLFFDVGANYGLHSLLWLAHGVPTVSFEPNPNCHDYLRRACQLNHLACDIHALALSDQEGETELWFPERETWMGTTDAGVRDSLARDLPLLAMKVAQTTIDAFVSRHGCRPDLIKIDTEGNEVRVLRGSRETLRRDRPLVIVESWPGARDGLIALLEESGYQIAPLPVRRASRPQVLDSSSFCEHPGRNFIAFPAEQLGNGRSLL